MATAVIPTTHLAELIAVWRATNDPVLDVICNRDYPQLVPCRILIQDTLVRLFKHTHVDTSHMSNGGAAFLKTLQHAMATRDTVDAFAHHVATYIVIPRGVLAVDNTGCRAITQHIHLAFIALVDDARAQKPFPNLNKMYAELQLLEHVPIIHVEMHSPMYTFIIDTCAKCQIIIGTSPHEIASSFFITQIIVYTLMSPDTTNVPAATAASITRLIITPRDAYFLLLIVAATYGFHKIASLQAQHYILPSV